ncbi:hypothetical protein JD77_02443 [Micromonospora olivasterospora]|uniref:Uncharacterized protein n=1 Tax=Micromonospora olivasterospora TaxID=1880 RepID=A0A562I9L5_MICOL|nr:hypothetical protein JD77_02443 [Micromonospora olivasterospora]
MKPAGCRPVGSRRTSPRRLTSRRRAAVDSARGHWGRRRHPGHRTRTARTSACWRANAASPIAPPVRGARSLLFGVPYCGQLPRRAPRRTSSLQLPSAGDRAVGRGIRCGGGSGGRPGKALRPTGSRVLGGAGGRLSSCVPARREPGGAGPGMALTRRPAARPRAPGPTHKSAARNSEQYVAGPLPGPPRRGHPARAFAAPHGFPPRRTRQRPAQRSQQVDSGSPAREQSRPRRPCLETPTRGSGPLRMAGAASARQEPRRKRRGGGQPGGFDRPRAAADLKRARHKGLPTGVAPATDRRRVVT